MNKRVINFLLTILFVVLVGFWIYSSVRDEFLKQNRASQRRTVETVAAGYPSGDDEVNEWLKRLAEEGSEYRVALVPEIPMPGEKLESTPKGDADLAKLTEDFATDAEFSKGFDNAAYEEIYRSVKNWKVGTKEVDFIATKDAMRIYYQVTDEMIAESTRARELAPLMEIKDNYEKIVVTRSVDSTLPVEGIKIIRLTDFLME